jgi:hypothetical protein
MYYIGLDVHKQKISYCVKRVARICVHECRRAYCHFPQGVEFSLCASGPGYLYLPWLQRASPSRKQMCRMQKGETARAPTVVSRFDLP